MFRTLGLNVARYFPAFLKNIQYAPTSVVMSLTNRCNCRCVMCNYWKSEHSDEISKEKVQEVLGEAKRLGVTDCLFYGGEPLLRADIFDLVAFAHNIGLRTKIITNGVLLDQRKAALLKESGLDEIVVSIDACNTFHDEIRGVEGVFDKAVAGLEELCKFKSLGLKVSVASIFMLPTLKEERLLGIIRLAEKMGVPVIIQLLDFSLFYFQTQDKGLKERLWISSGSWGDLDRLVDKLLAIKKEKPYLIANSSAALKYIKSYFRDPRDRHLPCYRAYSGKVWIDPEGKVFVCQGLPCVGDLKNMSLTDIISSSAWKEAMLKMFLKQCPGCSCDYMSNVDCDLFLSWRDILKRKLKLDVS